MSFDVFLPVFSLVLLGFSARFLQESWIAPGAFYSLYWILVVSLTLSFPEYYQVWPGALWWILLSVFMFVLGTGVGGKLLREGKQTVSVFPVESTHYRLTSFILIGMSIGFLTVYILDRHFRLAPTFAEIARPPRYLPVFFISYYATPVLGGICFALKSMKFRRLLALLSVLPFMTSNLAFAGRSGIALCASLWLAGFFSVRTLIEQGRYRLFFWKNIIWGALGGLVIYWLAILITQFRYAYDPSFGFGEIVRVYITLLGSSEDEIDKGWDLIRHGFTGGVPAFSIWFEGAWKNPPEMNLLESRLFMGPMDFLGFAERLPMEPVEVEPGIVSNVFGVFRTLIDSFSLWGSLMVLFSMGVLMGWAHRLVIAGEMRAIPLMVFFYIDVMNGGIAFAYNSLGAAYFVVGIYVFWWRHSLLSSKGV